MFAKRRPDPAVSSFAAQAALLQLRRLTAEMAGVRLNEDVEAIHRSRVASRRLRAVLDTFQGSLPEKKAARWLKQVREITRSLGAARDTVQGLDMAPFPGLTDLRAVSVSGG